MIRGMLFLHLNQNCGEYDETFVEWAMFRVLLRVVFSVMLDKPWYSDLITMK